MRRPLHVLLAAAAACALLAAAPARAQSLDGPMGPFAIQPPPGLAPLYASILQGLDTAARYSNAGLEVPEMVGASAAAPVVNATGEQVATAIGTVMAAAMMQTDALSSLGAPDVFKYPMDRKRVALFKLPRIPRNRIRGTCIFVHGCKHDPHSWFYKSKKCPRCTGLPEEVSHSKQCLARGYAVLALMSKDRRYRFRCFSSSGDKTLSDQADSAVVVKAWTKKFGLANKAKFIFGVSSGASFAVKFPMTMWVDGVISEVNMPWEEQWGATDGRGNLKVRFPPTAFYMMQRDDQTRRQIEAAIRIFKRNRVPADYVYVPAVKVGKSFFSDRSIYFDRGQSASIQKALKRIGVLDKNGFVAYDVREKRKWTGDLLRALPWLKKKEVYNLVSDESQIWQSLNLAWAKHEIVSDYVRPTLMWLESKGKKNLNSLVKQYSLDGKISCLTERREGC